MAINLTGLPVPLRGIASLPLFPSILTRWTTFARPEKSEKSIFLRKRRSHTRIFDYFLWQSLARGVHARLLPLFTSSNRRDSSPEKQRCTKFAGELVGKQIGWQLDLEQKINDYFPSFREERKPTKWIRHLANSTVSLYLKNSSTRQSPEDATTRGHWKLWQGRPIKMSLVK